MNATQLYGPYSPTLELAKQFQGERLEGSKIILGDMVKSVEDPNHLMRVIGVNEGDYYPHGYVVCRSTTKFWWSYGIPFGRSDEPKSKVYKMNPGVEPEEQYPDSILKV